MTAVTQQLQSENNPKVDDDATILLTYDDSMAILEPSWNWPIGRKDMEIYGLTGAIFADNRNTLRVRMAEGYDGFQEEKMTLEERSNPYNDPFSLLAAVIRGKVKEWEDDDKDPQGHSDVFCLALKFILYYLLFFQLVYCLPKMPKKIP